MSTYHFLSSLAPLGSCPCPGYCSEREGGRGGEGRGGVRVGDNY